MSQVDYQRLRQEIALATRRAFDAVRAARPDEEFYAFALYTVDDAVGVTPSSNSEQAYQRGVSRWMADEPHKQWLESRGISLESFLLGDERWSPYQWEYECMESDGFHVVNELINNRGVGFYDEDDLNEFVKFKASVFASMVLALNDLNEQGYFGEGSVRNSLTVFCSVADSECSIWLEEDSARRLNPPQVFQQFEAERIKWISDGSEARPPEPDDVEAAYVSLVEKG